MTCFGTVVAICAQPAPVEPKVVLSLLKNPPLDRLLSVLEPRPELHDLRDRIVDQYGWFLDKTALTTEEITKLFDDRETKSDMFRRGDAFGALVFEILKRVSSDDDYLRYMVI